MTMVYNRPLVKNNSKKIAQKSTLLSDNDTFLPQM